MGSLKYRQLEIDGANGETNAPKERNHDAFKVSRQLPMFEEAPRIGTAEDPPKSVRTNRATFRFLKMGAVSELVDSLIGEETIEKSELRLHSTECGEDERHALHRIVPISQATPAENHPLAPVGDTGEFRIFLTTVSNPLIYTFLHSVRMEHRAVQLITPPRHLG